MNDWSRMTVFMKKRTEKKIVFQIRQSCLHKIMPSMWKAASNKLVPLMAMNKRESDTMRSTKIEDELIRRINKKME